MPPQAQELSRREITRPGDPGTSYAVFLNGKVYKVHVPQRRFTIAYADGTILERIEDQAPDGPPLPPADPAFAHLKPTPEQRAQMDRISNGLE
jgi:hypothetical protein